MESNETFLAESFGANDDQIGDISAVKVIAHAQWHVYWDIQKYSKPIKSDWSATHENFHTNTKVYFFVCLGRKMANSIDTFNYQHHSPLTSASSAPCPLLLGL